MSPFKKLRPGSGEIIILIVIGVLALIIITGHHEAILQTLYSPIPIVVLIIMLVEYLILKGSDRSSIYRRELEAARAKRRDDLLAMRAMETQLVDLRATLQNRPADSDETYPAEADPTLKTIEEVLRLIRERI